MNEKVIFSQFQVSMKFVLRKTLVIVRMVDWVVVVVSYIAYVFSLTFCPIFVTEKYTFACITIGHALKRQSVYRLYTRVLPKTQNTMQIKHSFN